MNHLSVEVIKKPCAFVLHIVDPLDTVSRLANFFEQRKIIVETFQMHRHRDGDAMIIVHCHIEKDRIYRTVDLMEQLPGIIKMERMEGKP